MPNHLHSISTTRVTQDRLTLFTVWEDVLWEMFMIFIYTEHFRRVLHWKSSCTCTHLKWKFSLSITLICVLHNWINPMVVHIHHVSPFQTIIPVTFVFLLLFIWIFSRICCLTFHWYLIWFCSGNLFSLRHLIFLINQLLLVFLWFLITFIQALVRK